MKTRLGTAQVDCSAWGSALDFFNPTVTTTTYLANAYQCAQYGTMPAPGIVTPNAPQTADEMTGAWTPGQAENTGADYAAATDAAIAAAIATGTYNPAGNLPVTATWLDTYKWPIIAAAAALAALVLAQGIRK
jgi:hypothetical protein